jgi:hypothetical protein
MWIVKAKFAGSGTVIYYGPYSTELMAELIVAYLLRGDCASATYHHLYEL